MQESVAKEIEAVAKKRSRGAEITWKVTKQHITCGHP